MSDYETRMVAFENYKQLWTGLKVNQKMFLPKISTNCLGVLKNYQMWTGNKFSC